MKIPRASNRPCYWQVKTQHIFDTTTPSVTADNDLTQVNYLATNHSLMQDTKYILN